MASESSSAVTLDASSFAAALRRLLTACAAFFAASSSWARSASSCSTFSGEASKSSKSYTALSLHVITSDNSGPHRRVSSSNSWMRPLMASRSSTLASLSTSPDRLNTTSDRSVLMESSRSASSENTPSTWMARNACEAWSIKSAALDDSTSSATCEASNAPNARVTPSAISAAFSMRSRRARNSSISPGCGSTRLMRSIDSRR